MLDLPYTMIFYYYKNLLHYGHCLHELNLTVWLLCYIRPTTNCDILHVYYYRISWKYITNDLMPFCREKWLSILHHIVNIHQWEHNEKFHKCSHPARSNTERTHYLRPDSPAYLALRVVIMDKNLLKCLPMLTKFCHTGLLEAYHSMVLKYCPKNRHFPYEGLF